MTGRRVLITGASSGIGRSMASTFADAGAQLVLLDVDASGLARVSLESEGAGCPAVLCHTIDLGNKSEVDAFWDGLPADSRPDTIINNAAIYPMRASWTSMRPIWTASCRSTWSHSSGCVRASSRRAALRAV